MGPVEELVLRTIAAHAESLLRTARKHSMCVDDAQDAYQRAVELFMGHAPRLDAARAPAWLHVVVKREAMAIARARRKLLMASEVDLDGRAADGEPTVEEQLLRFDTISRSAEALKRLKPHEVRALWLRAQGHSYSDISALTGWSYTKVNRCLSEGRRHFLERYEGIESGAECERWLPVLSAMVDGEATPEQMLEVRPHLRNCPGCRATLRALQDSSTPLAALLPVPLPVVDAGIGDHVMQLATRLYEGLAGGLHERAVHSITKAHAILEATAASKAAAVAASAAAVAGGGYASVERIVEQRPGGAVVKPRTMRAAPPVAAVAWRKPRVRATATGRTAAIATAVRRSALGAKPQRPPRTPAPEFRAVPTSSSAAAARTFAARPASGDASRSFPAPAPRTPAPEFAPAPVTPAPAFAP